MYEISITVQNKKAQVQGNPVIVCGNSDYVLSFDLDSDWDEVTGIKAQIAYLQNGHTVRQTVPVLPGGMSPFPAISGAREVQIGVYGGSIRTAAPAVIPCMPCETDIPGARKTAENDVYNAIMEVLANAGN